MAYEDNLAFDSMIDTKFVRLSCRLRAPIADLVLSSGTTYYYSITHGPVFNVKVDGTAYTEGASVAALVAGEFYYDRTAQRIYIKFSGAPATEFITLFIYLFFAEQELLWYETPDDDTTPLVLWRPLLKHAPAFKLTIPPKGFGFIPIEQTSMTLANDTSLNYLLGNASFRRTSVEVWHQLGIRDIANMRKHLTGVTGLRVSVSDDEISMDVTDKSINFDRLIHGRNMSGVTALDPKWNNTVAMKAIGSTQGISPYETNFSTINVNSEDDIVPWTTRADAWFEMANMDYNVDAPSTSNNRKFGLFYDPDNTYNEISISGTINPGSVNGVVSPTTALQARLFAIDEVVWWDGPTDYYGTVTDVDYSTTTPKVILSSYPPAATNVSGTLRKSVFDVYLIKGGVTPYRLKYGRDFTETMHITNIKGITLTSTAEANVGAATFNPDEDSIWCIPNGRSDQLTFDGNNIGGANPFKTGEKILLQFLKDEAELAESEIDWTNIQLIEPYVKYGIFVPMPFASFSEYPSVREVLDLILKSLLCRGYFNNEGQFTVRPYIPISTTDETFAKEHIDKASYEYEIDYADVLAVYPVPAWESRAQIRLQYVGSKADVLAGTSRLTFSVNEDPAYASQATSSDQGGYLHETEVAEVYEHLVAADIEYTSGGVPYSFFEDRLRSLFGERTGLLKLRGRRLAMLRDVGDKATVSRDSLVGYEDETGLTAPMEIVEIEKADGQTQLTLNDNKAAQDDASAFFWRTDLNPLND